MAALRFRSARSTTSTRLGAWWFDFDASLTKPTITFWSGCIGGAFLSLATHGADQMMVQRYLCAKNRSAASWALGLSGFVVFAQFAVFLFIGVGWRASIRQPARSATNVTKAMRRS